MHIMFNPFYVCVMDSDRPTNRVPTQFRVPPPPSFLQVAALFTLTAEFSTVPAVSAGTAAQWAAREKIERRRSKAFLSSFLYVDRMPKCESLAVPIRATFALRSNRIFPRERPEQKCEPKK